MELVHSWSKEQKAAYNRDYYQKHKDYWKKHGDNTSARLSYIDERYAGLKGEKKQAEQEYMDYIAGKYGPPDRYTAWEKYQNALNAGKNTEVRRQMLEGDMAMVRGTARAHQKMETQRYPQVMYNFKEQRKLKVKNFVKGIVNKVKTAASTAGHKVTNAGKEFVANWKRGVGIK